MIILADFGMFAYEILKHWISLISSLATIYVIFYFIFWALACGSKSDHKQLRKTFNTGVMNLVKSMTEITYACLDSAKLWSEEKIIRNENRRQNRGRK